MSMDKRLEDGPLEFWNPNKPASPSQLRALAFVACRLLNLPEPSNRLAATESLVRGRVALESVTTEIPDLAEAIGRACANSDDAVLRGIGQNRAQFIAQIVATALRPADQEVPFG